MKKKLKIIGWIALASLVIIQFFPIETTNPEPDPLQEIFAKFGASDGLIIKIKDACYDCHSYETDYPWYTRIQPVGWWMKGHIEEARKHLNFSEFATYNDKKSKHKFEECVEYVEEKWMPIKSFQLTHPEARLTTEERAEMVHWFQKCVKSYN
ncbi:heme-binding domain-containing protein [Portibacter lacus]|uniref:Heme-binding protein n=1 Tax=Portibacter lacus TaxID=1099794 RepID=A0AA37SN56_9BACT|nr:heme-binding domain-containing protein [Portibacter lacus]GLR15693.1 heme-binding protein [Portibacter lacus]